MLPWNGSPSNRVMTIIIFLVSGPVLSPALNANEIFTASEFQDFCNRHQHVDNSRLKASMADFYSVYHEHDRDGSSKIIQPTVAELSEIIRKSIRFGWGSLELFTGEVLTRNGACTIFIDRESLATIDSMFDLHSLWMIRASTRKNGAVSMKFLLAGNGKLVMGYDIDKTRKIKVRDYDLHTGLYEYEPYLAMRIRNDKKRGLFGIRVRKSPASSTTSFIGPLNARIRSMEVDKDKIVVSYRFFIDATETVDKLPIEKK